ncbi:hypothetical protein N8T08_004426 [Aspergillus melleus]|uniref:Uncharacterized protein n=1 Tax=Aspergillus melleus TaxID=138277 RepID=A0ACC3B4W8_9EURO|nr:hypothetical protein N8T08_004426 [Aspergillus melleus]
MFYTVEVLHRNGSAQRNPGRDHPVDTAAASLVPAHDTREEDNAHWPLCLRVVIVSLGRLITLLKAGAALEADLTWTTIEYICWVQCEGPISLMSVCLPNILELVRRLRKQNQSSSAAMSLSTTKQTASDYLSGNRSFRPLEEDREAILMGHYQGTAKRSEIHTTIDGTRSVSERDSL